MDFQLSNVSVGLMVMVFIFPTKIYWGQSDLVREHHLRCTSYFGIGVAIVASDLNLILADRETYD